MTAGLADRVWPEIGHRPTVLVPVGSLEQHGPHLPLDTDTVIAEAVASRVAARLGDGCLVAPPLTYGSSGEHQSFAGTTSIGTQVLQRVLVEVVRSLGTWAVRVAFVNAHGGNASALVDAVSSMRREQHDVAWVACATEDVDLHAGRTETSLMLHLRPASVRLERAEAGETRPLVTILPLMVAGGVAAVSANGVLGDPSGATAAEGRLLIDTMVEDAVVRLRTGAVDAAGVAKRLGVDSP